MPSDLRVVDRPTDVEVAQTPPPSGRFAHAVSIIFVITMVAALNVAWFAPFRGRTLMGDDLELLLEARSGGYASDVVRAFWQVGADKFRPVLTVVLAVLTDAFGADFTAYRTLNLVLQTLNVLLVGFLAWRLSGRRWPITLAAMVIVTLSRFNVYFVLQVYGVMEGLALTFVLAMILAVIRAYETRSRRALAIASLGYFLAIFTHERYIVLAPFLVAATLLVPDTFRRRRDRLVWAALPLLVAFSNYAVKAWALKIHYFTAGGGEQAEFAPGQIATFMERGLLNLTGFNTGPDYLSGRNMHSLGVLGVALGLLFVVPLAVLLVVSVRRDASGLFRGQVTILRKYLLASLLLGPLLFSASISFRQEYRWLYTPFVVLVLGTSWMLGRLPRGRVLPGLLIAAVCVGAVGVDGYYRRHVENTYFFAGLDTVDSLRTEILGRHSAQLDSATVFIFTHDDPTLTDWYTRGGRFFDIYAPGRNRDIRFVSSIEATPTTEPVRATVLAFDYRFDSVVDVTNDFLRLHEAELSRQSATAADKEIKPGGRR